MPVGAKGVVGRWRKASSRAERFPTFARLKTGLLFFRLRPQQRGHDLILDAFSFFVPFQLNCRYFHSCWSQIDVLSLSFAFLNQFHSLAHI